MKYYAFSRVYLPIMHTKRLRAIVSELDEIGELIVTGLGANHNTNMNGIEQYIALRELSGKGKTSLRYMH